MSESVEDPGIVLEPEDGTSEDVSIEYDLLQTKISWPPGVTTFRVICRLGMLDVDGSDEGQEPDLKTMGGSVTITPDVTDGRIRILEVDGRHRVVSAVSRTYYIDPYSGELVNGEDMAIGVELINSYSPNIDPQGFTYTALVTPYEGDPYSITFDATAAVNGVYDLTSWVEVEKSGGTRLVDGKLNYLDELIKETATKVDQIEAEAIGKGQDKRVPAKVSNLKANTRAYLDNNGSVRGELNLSWDEVTHARPDDGGAFLQVSEYEVGVQRGSSTAPIKIHKFEQNKGMIDEMNIGEAVVVRARARGLYATAPGLWSDPIRIKIEGTLQPPPAPSRPVLTSAMSSVSLSWDGLTEAGLAQPSDFIYAEVEWRVTRGDKLVVETDTLRSAGLSTVTKVDPGTVVEARIRSINNSTLVSGWVGPLEIEVESMYDAPGPLGEGTLSEEISNIQRQILEAKDSADEASEKILDYAKRIQEIHELSTEAFEAAYNNAIEAGNLIGNGEVTKFVGNQAVGWTPQNAFIKYEKSGGRNGGFIRLTPRENDAWALSSMWGTIPGRTYMAEGFFKRVGTTSETSAVGFVAFMTFDGGSTKQVTFGVVPSNQVSDVTWTKLGGMFKVPDNVIRITIGPWAKLSDNDYLVDSVYAYDVTEAERARVRAVDAAQSAEEASEMAARAIVKSTIEYAVSSSYTNPPATGWSTATPSKTPGIFVWMRTIIEYASGEKVNSSPAVITGNQGPKGDPGTSVSINGRVPSKNSLPTTSPEGTGYLAEDTGRLWIMSEGSWIDVGVIRGPEGVPGKDGEDADALYVWIKYADTPTSGISDNPNGKAYMGIAYNKETPDESNEYSDYVWSLIKGEDGKEGPPGEPGAPGKAGSDGVSVEAITPFYRMLSDSLSAPETPTTKNPNGWSTEEPDYTKGHLLWRSERVDYSNGGFSWTPVTQVSSWVIAVKAMNSSNGKNSRITSTSGPSGRINPETDEPYVDGDTWIQWDGESSRNAISQYVYRNGVWMPEKIKSEVIANLDVNKLTVSGSARMSRVVLDKIVGDAAHFNLITGERLFIGSPDNLLPGVSRWGEEGASPMDLGIETPGTLDTSNSALQLKGNSSTIYRANVEVREGASYLFEVESKSDLAGSTFYIQFLDTNTRTLAGGLVNSPVFTNQQTDVDWRKHEAQWIAPKTATVNVQIHANHQNGKPNPNGFQWFRNMRLRPLVPGTLIEPDSIDTPHLKSNSVGTKQLQAGSVGADQVQANAIGTEKLVVKDFENLWRDQGYLGDFGVWEKSPKGGIQKVGSKNSHGDYFPHTEIPVMGGETLTATFSIERDGPGQNVNLYIQGFSEEKKSWLYLGILASCPAGSNAVSRREVTVPDHYRLVRFGLYTTVGGTESSLHRVYDIEIRRQIGATIIEKDAITTRHIALESLDAGVINSDSYRGRKIVGAELIAGENDGPTDEYVKVADKEIAIYRRLQDEESVRTVLLGGNESDEFSLADSDGNETIGFYGGSGDANISGTLSAQDLVVGGKAISEFVPENQSLVVSVNQIPSNSGSGTSGYPACVSRIRFTMEKDMWYRVRLTGSVISSNENVAYTGTIHRNDNGEATMSNQVVDRYYGLTNQTRYNTIAWDYFLTGDGEVSLMHTLSTSSPKASVYLRSVPASISYLVVENLGRLNRSDAIFDRPSLPGAPSPNPDPVPTKRIYKRVYTAIGTRTWQNNSISDDNLGHGAHKGVKRVSQILFPDRLTSDLSGATVKSVRVRLKNVHTYYASGMNAYVGYNSHTSLQSSPVGAVYGTSSSGSAGAGLKVGWKKGEVKYVGLNSTNFASTSRSIWLGVGASSSLSDYGRFSRNLQDCLLEVVYEK